MSWIAGEVRAASREQVPGLVAEARDARHPLMASGRGSSLGRGLPPAAPPHRLDLGALNRVVDYPADDFTITVEAGLPLGELNRVLADHGHWFPPAGAGAGDGTVGGLIAADRRSLWAGRYGGVGEFVLGMVFLNPAGEEVRVGSRVVKSVAGYDLMKLFTGSLGQLGPILEVTLRVLAVPRAWRVLWWDVRPEDSDRRRLLLEVPRRAFPEAFVRCAGDHGERWGVALAGSEARVQGLADEAALLAGPPARAEESPEALVAAADALLRPRRPGSGFGGLNPAVAWGLALGDGDWILDLLEGHAWWRSRDGTHATLGRWREHFADGVLHWEHADPDASAWGWNGGAEGIWWTKLKQALDPEGAWVGGRWPGGR